MRMAWFFKRKPKKNKEHRKKTIKIKNRNWNYL